MRRYGFSRKSRLLRPGDFACVFKDAIFKGHHKSILLLARPNDLSCPRLGFVIAKRNVKLANQRNRIKRVIRDQFRLQQHALPTIDIVMIARKQLADMKNEEIKLTIDKLFSNLSRQYAKNLSSKQA